MFARTVYRELRRADYSNEELVRFVTDLIELVTTHAGAGPRKASRANAVKIEATAAVRWCSATKGKSQNGSTSTR